MKILSKILVFILIPLFLFSCSNKNIITETENIDTDNTNGAPNNKPIILGYFPSWSENWVSAGSAQPSKLRDIPKHVTHVFLAFAKPNLRYTKGSLNISKTGIQTPYSGDALKESVSILKKKGTKVILSIGGETYWSHNDAYNINYQEIKDLVDDMGFEGIDWDYEPNGSFTTIGNNENIQHFIDFFTKSRAIMPKGKYLLACAPTGVGALGGVTNNDTDSPFAYSKRNTITGEPDTNLFKATVPNKAISLFGFTSTGHMIPVMKSVGNKIDLIAYQGYNCGAASNREIMFDSYKYYAKKYGFSIAAGIHFPNEPWGPYYEYNYENVAGLSKHIKTDNTANNGIMIWQLLLKKDSKTAYGYLNTASKVLNGIPKDKAIKDSENY